MDTYTSATYYLLIFSSSYISGMNVCKTLRLISLCFYEHASPFFMTLCYLTTWWPVPSGTTWSRTGCTTRPRSSSRARSGPSTTRTLPYVTWGSKNTNTSVIQNNFFVQEQMSGSLFKVLVCAKKCTVSDQLENVLILWCLNKRLYLFITLRMEKKYPTTLKSILNIHVEKQGNNTMPSIISDFNFKGKFINTS